MSALTSSPATPACSEHDLVAAVRRGEDRAFGELYTRYGGRIVAYVFGMVGDYARAEDITQEVFISALRRMRETERPIAFKAWIYEIARNASIDEFRRAKRAREVPLASDDDDDSRRSQPLASGAHSPHATFERRQQLDDLRGAFRGLTDNHHKLIVMRELEGLSYEEIGKRVGMSRPMVESTLFRARRRLNDEYQEIASGRRCEQVCAAIEAGAKTISALGLRERRRLARHVSHCQPCRRFARAEGLDDSVFQTPGLAGKVAALLPVPAFLRWFRVRGGAAGPKAAPGAGSHSVSALQSVQTAAQYIDPSSPAVGLGRVGAAVAAVVIAGGGVVGGLSVTSSGKRHTAKPAAHVVPAASPGSPSAHISGSASAGRPRVHAARPVTRSRPPRHIAAKPRATRAARSNSSQGTTVAGASNSLPSGSNGPSGGSVSSAASPPTGAAGSGGNGSSTGGLPRLTLPVPRSLPAVPLPQLPQLSVPQLNIPQLNIPGTLQNALNGANQTIGNMVNTIKGIL